MSNAPKRCEIKKGFIGMMKHRIRESCDAKDSALCLDRPRFIRLSPSKGERIEVRGFGLQGDSEANPHPNLSLAKGEATELMIADVDRTD